MTLYDEIEDIFGKTRDIKDIRLLFAGFPNEEICFTEKTHPTKLKEYDIEKGTITYVDENNENIYAIYKVMDTEESESFDHLIDILKHGKRIANLIKFCKS